MIREDLRAYLYQQANLTALIGTTNDSIALSHIPQSKTYPGIAFRRRPGPHMQDLDGAAGYVEAPFDFVAFGLDPEVVEQVTEQLRISLQGFRGLQGATEIQRLSLDDESDDYIYGENASDQGLYLTTFTFTVGYKESTPVFSQFQDSSA